MPTDPTTTAPASNPEMTAHQWGQARLAHEAAMLQDAVAVLEEDRAFTRTHREQMLDTELEPADVGNIRIGDEVHYHGQPDPGSAPATVTEDVSAAPAVMSTIGKVAVLAAAVAAGGIPGGIASYLATRQPAEPAAISPASAPAPASDIDRDWSLSLLPPAGPADTP